MGLADRIATENGKKGGPQTLRVDALLAELSSSDRKALRAALEDPTVSSRAIARAVEQEGHSLSEGAVNKWRRRHGVTR